jgi:hypothetical protein
MAHFAKINSENIVEQVIVVHNNDAPDEATGIAFIESLGFEGVWKQTSYNTRFNTHIQGGTPFRKNHASVGHSYNEELDAFLFPKPFDSWVLDEETYDWKAPLPKPEPTETIGWRWNESVLSWTSFAKSPIEE